MCDTAERAGCDTAVRAGCDTAYRAGCDPAERAGCDTAERAGCDIAKILSQVLCDEAESGNGHREVTLCTSVNISVFITSGQLVQQISLKTDISLPCS